MSINNNDFPADTASPDAPVPDGSPALLPQSSIPLTTENLTNHQEILSVDHSDDDYDDTFSGSENTTVISHLSVALTLHDSENSTVEFVDDFLSDFDTDSNFSGWSIPTNSTYEWGQTPFAEYQFAVQEFAAARIWPGAPEDRITVERMKGTEANRMTGVSLAGENGEDDQHFILRQTRDGMSTPACHPRPAQVRYDHDAAFCSFLRTHTTLEVEDVIMYDLGCYNDLGDRYIVQKRIPGVDAKSVVDDLTHEQRCRMAREIGLIFRERLAVKSTHAGYVEITADPEDLEGKNPPLYSIAPFGWHHRWGNHQPWYDWEKAVWLSGQTDEPEPPPPPPPPFMEWPAFDGDGPSTPYSEGPAVRCTEAMMVELLSRVLEIEVTRYPDDPIPDEAIKPCRKLIRIAQQLGTGGILDDIWNCPVTFDGFRVNLEAGPDEPMVTGEVNHTGGFIGPSFAACATPYWLWVEAPNRKFDEVFPPAHDRVKPATEQQREVKAIFEEAAGPDYRRFANNFHYEMARKMLYFAVYGDIWHQWVLDAAVDAIKDWDDVRAEDKFPNLPSRLEDLFASDTE